MKAVDFEIQNQDQQEPETSQAADISRSFDLFMNNWVIGGIIAVCILGIFILLGKGKK